MQTLKSEQNTSQVSHSLSITPTHPLAQMTFCTNSHKPHLLCVQLSQVTQDYSKGLCVILLNAHIHSLQTVHAQQCLGLLECHGACARETCFSFQAINTTSFNLCSCYDTSLHFLVSQGPGREWKLVKQLLSRNSGLHMRIKYYTPKAAHSLSTEMLKTGTGTTYNLFATTKWKLNLFSSMNFRGTQQNGSNCSQPVQNHSLIALF